MIERATQLIIDQLEAITKKIATEDCNPSKAYDYAEVTKMLCDVLVKLSICENAELEPFQKSAIAL